MEKFSPEQREEVRKIVREQIKKPTCKAYQLQKLPRLLKKKLKRWEPNLALIPRSIKKVSNEKFIFYFDFNNKCYCYSA